jgi:predicted CXXCH cytochrome family protein
LRLRSREDKDQGKVKKTLMRASIARVVRGSVSSSFLCLKFFFLTLALTLAFTFTSVFPVFAVDEPHLDRSKLPGGCSSCHKGHGKRATVMLDSPKDELCFKCHGPAGRGAATGPRIDIYSVILKRSNHPVLQTSQYHVPGETLPERSPSTPRHVSCYDCHNVHALTKDKPLKGVRGYSGKGAKVTDVQREYQVCYVCHSDSANLPVNSTNMAREFDAGNRSFHPVEAVGRNRSVPSLKTPLSTASIINCSDCHGNDDKTGPKGPHGSTYQGMLSEYYTTDSGPESLRSYELCYKCHNRNSILNDDSFKSHKRHVVYGNVPCFACHDSHGSRDYEHLIKFDQRVVLPNSLGQLSYMKLVPGKPRCFLNCHVGPIQYDHKIIGAQYCVSTPPPVRQICPPGW